MKQNERLLVYAVTGFLAVILLVAVLFGPSGDDAASKSGVGNRQTVGGPNKTDGAPGLGEILGQVTKNPSATTGTPGSNGAGANAPNAETGKAPGAAGTQLLPGQIAPQQPLVANERPLLAMDLVAQQIGPSRRDRTVRMVRAKAGDSLETLVRRWCGARDPFLEEANSLNEDLRVLRVGQEVCVPWVDDEVVLAAYEASKPKTLVPVGGATNGADTRIAEASASPGNPERPTFQEPGAVSGVRSEPKATRSAGATTEYVVKAGDALWKIAERTYGKQNAKRMVAEIQQANPGLGETVRVGQKIVLPAK